MLFLQSLGELRLDGEPLPRLLSPRKELVLLVYLARRAPRPVDRAELATLLWDARRPDRARQSLRQALLDLRRLLPGAVDETSGGIRFQGEAVRFDVAEFEEALSRGEPAAAVALWQGEFLAGVEDTAGEELRVWIEAERERLRRELRVALESLIGGARNLAAWTEAIVWGERWVDLLPLDERGHYQLAETLLLAGRPAEAWVRYERASAGLRSALGVEPSLAFLQLESRIERAAQGSALRGPGAAMLRVPDLVGRQQALGQLESAWRAVREGGAAALLVEGEPGAGKSRLVEAFIARLQAAEQPPVIVSVRLTPSDRDVGLAGVTALVLGLADAPGLGGAPAAALAELARLAPGLRVRFPDLPVPAGSCTALAGALVDGIGAVAAERPVVLLFEDLPHADEESAAALRVLLRQSPSNVLALATARTGLGRLTAGQIAFAESRALNRLKLQPLDQTGVHALLDSMLDLPAEDRNALAPRLHTATGGNPHLAVELVAAMTGSGALRLEERGGWRLAARPDEPLPVPAVVREAIEQRLVSLGREARGVVEAAAVLDGRIETEALSALSGLSAASTLAAIDELRSAGLVHSVGTGAGIPDELVPALLGRVVYDRLASAGRDALHRAAAAHYGARARRDPAARAAAAHHQGRSQRGSDRGARRRHVAQGVAALLLLIGVALMTGGTGPPPERAEVPRIAVMPFAVRGGTEIAHLGQAMAELLSTALDGGAVRTISPWRLPGADTEVHDAAGAAAGLGATEVLVGRVVEGGGSIRVEAELYTAGERPERIARVEAEGVTDSAFAVADALARELLVQPGRSGSDRLSELAARATQSLPALKGFLEGRRQYRAMRFDSAVATFRGAVEADSGFALAWYGLGRALSWNARDEDALSAASRAAAHSAVLPRQEQLVIEGFRAHMAALPQVAESLFRVAIGLESHHLEAWYNLGEVLYHYHWALGRPISQSWAALGAALQRDPGYGPAAIHLAQLAALEGRRGDLDSLVSHWREVSPVAVRRYRLDVLQSFVNGEAAERRQIAAELRDTLPYVAWGAAWTVGLFGRDLEGAESLARVWADNPGDFGPVYRMILADLSLARGRWETAQAELARAGAIRPGWALEHRALLAISPAVALPAQELAALRAELRRWNPATERPSVYPHQSIQVPQAIRPLTRLMLLGVLSAVIGDGAEAERYAAEVTRPEEGEHRRLRRSIAREIRARAALERGEVAAALALLETDTLAFRDDQLRFSPVYARVSARFARAEALRLAGRLEEALGWYESIVSQNLHELVYLAPVERRRAELYMRLGMIPEAERSRRAAAALWAEADPALLTARAGTRSRAPARRSAALRAGGVADARAARRDRSVRTGRSRPAARIPPS